MVGIGQVFMTGLVLGGLRWRRGSTLLTILLHLLVNIEGTSRPWMAQWSGPTRMSKSPQNWASRPSRGSGDRRDLG